MEIVYNVYCSFQNNNDKLKYYMYKNDNNCSYNENSLLKTISEILVEQLCSFKQFGEKKQILD